MKEYVQRCFTACESEEDKDRTEKMLKDLLQSRLQDGSAYTIDWNREPLPEWVASLCCLFYFFELFIQFSFLFYKWLIQLKHSSYLTSH